MNYQANKQQTKNAEIKSWKQALVIEKRQIQSFENDLPKQFTFLLTVPQSAQIVSKILKQNQQKQILLQKQQKKISSRLTELNSAITQLKQTLKYYEYTNQYLVKVQNLSEGVYGKIQRIKQTMATQFQCLLDAEDAIENDLKLYNRKIEMITSGQYEGKTKNQQNQADFGNRENRKIQSATKKSVTNIKTQLNIPKNIQNMNKQKEKQVQLAQDLQQIINQIKKTQEQVQSIQNKINSLGKNLGWNEEDHTDFIKIWNRCQGKNYFQIQQEMNSYFKLYTEEQIRDHMNKYMKFKQLNQHKKQKIIYYKQSKEQKKLKQFQILSLREQKQKNIQNKQKNIKNIEEEHLIMKQKLQQWKKIKSNQKFKEEQIKKEEQRRKIQEKNRKAEQNMQKKQVVQRWKEQQEEKNTKKLKQSRDTKRTAPRDKQTEERIRQRQQKLIAEKVQKLMKKKIEEEDKLEKQQRLKQRKMIKYSYVNSKLQQKTTAMKEKQREKFDGKNKVEANTFGGNLLHHGIRATPAWMQGL